MRLYFAAMFRVFAILSFFLIPVICQSEDYFYDFNSRCMLAYQHYSALQLAEGDASVHLELQINPHNLIPVYLSDYNDFMLLAFNGDPETFKRCERNEQTRLSQLDLSADNQPWKRLCKAGICLHWAIIYGRMGSNFKAATSFRTAYLLLKENAIKFPDFAQNDAMLGLAESIAGTIPDEYKWIASLFGMKGNLTQGSAKLSAFLKVHTDTNEPLHNELVIYDAYIRFYLLSQQEAVWNFINSDQFPIKNNLLNAFVKTNLALNYRKAAAAIQTLNIAKDIPGYNNFPVFDYEFGQSLLAKLDPSSIAAFSRFVTRNTGKLYTKDAWQKIAFAWMLQGENGKAIAAKNSINETGTTSTDADKQAQRFASGDKIPNIVLLRARLLIDGGYYAQALQNLGAVNEISFGDPADKTEYNFRNGRAFDETGQTMKALRSYQRAINIGHERQEYFAARSALQMALIYEKHDQKSLAIQYFQTALTMKHHDFQSSIDQQCKAGIGRLTNE